MVARGIQRDVQVHDPHRAKLVGSRASGSRGAARMRRSHECGRTDVRACAVYVSPVCLQSRAPSRITDFPHRICAYKMHLYSSTSFATSFALIGCQVGSVHAPVASVAHPSTPQHTPHVPCSVSARASPPPPPGFGAPSPPAKPALPPASPRPRPLLLLMFRCKRTSTCSARGASSAPSCARCGQGLTLVPISAQLKLMSPIAAQLELTLSPI